MTKHVAPTHAGTHGELRVRARELLLKHEPTLAKPRIWGGYGCNGRCDLCGAVICPTDVEYEIEAQAASNERTLHLHYHCFLAVEDERGTGWNSAAVGADRRGTQVASGI